MDEKLTDELQQYFTKDISQKLSNYLEHEVDLNIFFCVGYDNSPEGEYVYRDLEKYYYIFTEKGKTRVCKITSELWEITYWALDNYIFNEAVNYAKAHREEGLDFRRNLFAREREIWAILDKRCYEQKLKDIEKILEKTHIETVERK